MRLRGHSYHPYFHDLPTGIQYSISPTLFSSVPVPYSFARVLTYPLQNLSACSSPQDASSYLTARSDVLPHTLGHQALSFVRKTGEHSDFRSLQKGLHFQGKTGDVPEKIFQIDPGR